MMRENMDAMASLSVGADANVNIIRLSCEHLAADRGRMAASTEDIYPCIWEGDNGIMMQFHGVTWHARVHALLA